MKREQKCSKKQKILLLFRRFSSLRIHCMRVSFLQVDAVLEFIAQRECKRESPRFSPLEAVQRYVDVPWRAVSILFTDCVSCHFVVDLLFLFILHLWRARQSFVFQVSPCTLTTPRNMCFCYSQPIHSKRTLARMCA